MSTHLHGDFLMVCTRRRPKRTWGQTLASVLMLLALSALTGWLWSCVKHATLVRVPGLAMMPVPVAVMDGHGAAALACLAVGLPGLAWAVCWAVRKLKAFDDEARAMMNEEQGEDAELGRGADPLEQPTTRLNVEELRRIFGELLQQMQEARDLVKRAEGHLSVEDYGQDLAHAHLLMGLAIGCLAELLARTDPGLKSAPKGGNDA